MTRLALPARRRSVVSLPWISLVIALMATPGCLSRGYRIRRNELVRLTRVPPEYRWQSIKVLQRIAHTDRPDRNVEAQPPPSSSGGHEPSREELEALGMERPPRLSLLASEPPHDEPGSGHRSAGQLVHTVFVRNPDATQAPDRQEMISEYAGRTFWISAGMPVVGPWLVAGFAASEAFRFDGWLAVPRDEPVLIRTRDQQFLVPLSQLTTSMAMNAIDGHLYEGGRSRYVRRAGAKYARDGLGGSLVHLVGNFPTYNGPTVWGSGARLLTGFNYRGWLGFALSTDVMFATTDAQSNAIFVTTGFELQLFFLRYLGIYAGGGAAIRESHVSNIELRSGGGYLRAGVVGEVPVSTRLGVQLRTGVSTVSIRDSAESVTFEFGVGLALY